MEMTDDSLNSRLKGIADEIKTDDMSIIKKPMISLNDDDLNPTEYSRRIGEFVRVHTEVQILDRIY